MSYDYPHDIVRGLEARSSPPLRFTSVRNVPLQPLLQRTCCHGIEFRNKHSQIRGSIRATADWPLVIAVTAAPSSTYAYLRKSLTDAMASITPRASESGFWTNATMPTDYFPDEDRDAEQQLLAEEEDLVLVEGPTPVGSYLSDKGFSYLLGL